MRIEVSVFDNSSFKYLPKSKTEKVVRGVILAEGIQQAEINVVFADDDFIHSLNREYLDHDYVTDVISFVIESQPLIGEIYIGVEQARRQAKEYKVSLSNEIIRLAAHGMLHLAGYDDATEEERHQMHELENKYLNRTIK